MQLRDATQKTRLHQIAAVAPIGLLAIAGVTSLVLLAPYYQGGPRNLIACAMGAAVFVGLDVALSVLAYRREIGWLRAARSQPVRQFLVGVALAGIAGIAYGLVANAGAREAAGIGGSLMVAMHLLRLTGKTFAGWRHRRQVTHPPRGPAV